MIQDKVYLPMPGTLAELLAAVERHLDDLNNNHQNIIRRAVLNMKKRARKCLNRGGGVFEGMRV